jgi:hypothetical protein
MVVFGSDGVTGCVGFVVVGGKFGGGALCADETTQSAHKISVNRNALFINGE